MVQQRQPRTSKTRESRSLLHALSHHGVTDARTLALPREALVLTWCLSYGDERVEAGWMNLFATLSRAMAWKEQRAMAHVMASRDSRWGIASLGLKRPQASYAENHAHDEEQADPDVEMARLDDKIMGFAMTERVAHERPVSLSMRLLRASIAWSSIHGTRRSVTEMEHLVRQKVVRLDWLDIGKMENLEACPHVDELSLQHNLIERMEWLETHVALTFLALAGNRIRKMENLQHFIHTLLVQWIEQTRGCGLQLELLDLSMNSINEFRVSELPTSLRFLRLMGNRFVRQIPAYAQVLFDRLPNLVQVDQFRRPVP
ncbi:hypothetical protein PsorP6_013206 [Peronosclerospora sorghi]|uniref:Uncharacterized protein n=1 Tax=Peronosclerospora sorghi TaxID=230839 RepID=A0ACC0WGE7_9STRA|nr:hypothetical protein PsorP6_013206 [Peronosclerospora sorghi]